jgi:hypothetical protein
VSRDNEVLTNPVEKIDAQVTIKMALQMFQSNKLNDRLSLAN